MSQQINPVPVRDVVLDLDDKINFAVLRSGQNISVQRYPASSATSSQHTYNVQIPSLSTVVSRNVVWGATFTINVTGNVAAGIKLVNFDPVNANYTSGTDVVTVQLGDCLAPFPLNQMTTNCSIQLNNTTLSNQVNNILDPLLRAVDRSEFQRWNSTTPTQLDKYGEYTDALPLWQENAGTLAGNNIANQYPINIKSFNSPFNNFNSSNCNNDEVPRNSFEIISITGNDAGTGAAGTLQARQVAITVRVREPIFVSPFLFGETDGAGLSGLSQILITCQMDNIARRALRWVSTANTLITNKAVASVSYTQADCYIEMLYYTPKPSDLIPATIVTPLSTYTLYQLPAGSLVVAGATAQLTSNSIQLNSYFDKIFVWVDNYNKWGQYGNTVSDCYFPISAINLTLNNQSGILTTFSTEQLFRASMKSGSKQTWAEFYGSQRGVVQAGGAYLLQDIPTCGSVLMLDMATIINVAQDYFAPGSLSTCQFQLQNVTFSNKFNQDAVPQLNILVMNSGILSTSNGASSAYTSGVLSKEAVLNAAAQPAMNVQQLQRYVGSGLMSSLKSIATSVLPVAKKALGAFEDNKFAKAGKDALDALGYGKKLHKKLM